VFEDFEFGEVTVINNFRVYKDGAGWCLKRHKGIIMVNHIKNCRAAVGECLRNVLAQLVPYRSLREFSET